MGQSGIVITHSTTRSRPCSWPKVGIGAPHLFCAGLQPVQQTLHSAVGLIAISAFAGRIELVGYVSTLLIMQAWNEGCSLGSMHAGKCATLETLPTSRTYVRVIFSVQRSLASASDSLTRASSWRTVILHGQRAVLVTMPTVTCPSCDWPSHHVMGRWQLPSHQLRLRTRHVSTLHLAITIPALSSVKYAGPAGTGLTPSQSTIAMTSARWHGRRLGFLGMDMEGRVVLGRASICKMPITKARTRSGLGTRGVRWGEKALWICHL